MTDATTVLAFDVGLARIGVAVGQSVTGTATPLPTLNARSDALPEALARLVQQWRPAHILVGLPEAFDSPTSIRPHILAFAEDLGRFDRPVHLVDESLSSREAHERLKSRRQAGGRRIQRGDVDAEAARIIAEQWLANH